MLPRVSAPWVSALGALAPSRVWSPPLVTNLSLKECDGWTLGEDTVSEPSGVATQTGSMGCLWTQSTLVSGTGTTRGPWESPTSSGQCFLRVEPGPVAAEPRRTLYWMGCALFRDMTATKGSWQGRGLGRGHVLF